MKNPGQKEATPSNPHGPLFLGGAAESGIVVFIHGFMGSPRQFDSLAHAVHRQGISIASLLLPGHGGSAKDFGTGSFELWQRHVDSEIERLARDYANIWLVGHSMGGLLALNSAIRYSGQIRGIFPIACPFKLTILAPRSKIALIKRFFSRGRKQARAAYLRSCSVRTSPALFLHIPKQAWEVKKLINATRDSLHAVCAPVAAVYSKSDELTSLKSLGILKAGLTGAGFDQLVLSDSLHSYFPEKEQALIERMLLNFIME